MKLFFYTLIFTYLILTIAFKEVKRSVSARLLLFKPSPQLILFLDIFFITPIPSKTLVMS